MRRNLINGVGSANPSEDMQMNDNVHRFDESMRTDAEYKPGKAWAWGAAAQIDMLVQSDDPDLWESFFGFLRMRHCWDELRERMELAGD